MFCFTFSPAVRRLGATAGAAAAAVVLTAGPADAHVEVEADKAQALAENVTLDFLAETESDTAGITELRVVLPEGIAPDDVAYDEGPEGWKFTGSTDGYVVKGPAVAAGQDAEYSVTVRQLPDAKELAFKTLQTYDDGRTDRWIELGPSSDDGGHGNPAPVLQLKAAAPGAEPASPSPTDTPPTPTAEGGTASPDAVPETEAAAAEEEPDDGGGLSAAAWVGIAAGAVVVLAGVVYAVRRRAGAQG